MLDPGDLLERSQWDLFWVPADVQVVDRPEVLFMSCPRDVQILNTVTRTRAEEALLPALVQEVCAAHKGVRSRWLVRDQAVADPLRRALEKAGYAPASKMFEMAIGTGAYRERPSTSAQTIVKPVVDMATVQDCVAVIDSAFGGRRFTEEELAADLDRCTGQGARVRRFVAYDQRSSQPISSGGMTLFPGLSFGLFWGGGTVPDARGQGAYSAVIAARMAEAIRLGLTYVGLYAIDGMSAPIVSKQGFQAYGMMTYWERDLRSHR